MADGRAEKLKRLVRVQRQLERVAENELAVILRERAIVDDTRTALVDALGSLSPLHRSMAMHYTKRFSGIETRDRRLTGMQMMQEKRILTEKTKADRLQDQYVEAAEAEGREAEDDGLLDLIDIVISAKAGSSPA
jgi:hypothetical protein